MVVVYWEGEEVGGVANSNEEKTRGGKGRSEFCGTHAGKTAHAVMVEWG